MSIELLSDEPLARQYILFDYDGTLADTLRGITGTARTVLLQEGFTDEELGDLRRLVGPPFPRAFSQVYGLSEEDAVRVTARYREIYRGLGPDGWPLFDGIEGMLERLHAAGRRLAVVTAKRQEVIERCIADNGIGGLLDLVIGKRDDLSFSKADEVALALSELGASAEQCVMVGDRDGDVLAARANGVPCIGVTYGGTGSAQELADAGAAALVDTVEELERLLAGGRLDETGDA